MGGGGFMLLQGQAGTGKSYMLDSMLSSIRASTRKRVAITATTHRAAKIASKFANGEDVYTSHALLGFREDIDHDGNKVFLPGPTYLEEASNYHIIFCDEASQLADSVFDGFEELVHDGKKIIFIGDAFQTPPVGLENSLPFEVSVQRDLSFVVADLNEVVRQAKGSPIISLATEIRNSIFKPILPIEYVNRMDGIAGVEFVPRNARVGLDNDVLNMFSSKEAENPDYIKALAWRNDVVDDYNFQIREHLFGTGLPRIMVGDKLVADATYFEGRQVLIKNNEDLEVLYTTIEEDQLDNTTVLRVYKAHVRIHGLNNSYREAIILLLHEDSDQEYLKLREGLKALALMEKKGSYAHKTAWGKYYQFKERYAQVKYNYALTVHKAQGGTFFSSTVSLWDILTSSNVHERNRLAYTGITRASDHLKIIY